VYFLRDKRYKNDEHKNGIPELSNPAEQEMTATVLTVKHVQTAGYIFHNYRVEQEYSRQFSSFDNFVYHRK
jgi:hypothetical protein